MSRSSGKTAFVSSKDSLRRKQRVRIHRGGRSLPQKIILLQLLARWKDFCPPAEWHWDKLQFAFSFEPFPDHMTVSLMRSHKQLVLAEEECWKELFPSHRFWFLNLEEVLRGILMSRQREPGLSAYTVGLGRENRWMFSERSVRFFHVSDQRFWTKVYEAANNVSAITLNRSMRIQIRPHGENVFRYEVMKCLNITVITHKVWFSLGSWLLGCFLDCWARCLETQRTTSSFITSSCTNYI